MRRDDSSQKCPVNLELQLRLMNANIDGNGNGNRALRYRFAYACANRVRYQLEDARAIALLDVLQAYVEGCSDDDARSAAAEEAAALANHHRGSQSIDGTGHSAVSATYAVAAALGSLPATNHFPANGPCKRISSPRTGSQSPSGMANTGMVGFARENLRARRRDDPFAG